MKFKVKRHEIAHQLLMQANMRGIFDNLPDTITLEGELVDEITNKHLASMLEGGFCTTKNEEKCTRCGHITGSDEICNCSRFCHEPATTKKVEKEGCCEKCDGGLTIKYGMQGMSGFNHPCKAAYTCPCHSKVEKCCNTRSTDNGTVVHEQGCSKLTSVLNNFFERYDSKDSMDTGDIEELRLTHVEGYTHSIKRDYALKDKINELVREINRLRKK